MITTAPGPPTDVSVGIKNSTSVQVTWQEPIDTNGIIQGYQVFYFAYEGMLSIGQENLMVKPLLHTKNHQPYFVPLSCIVQSDRGVKSTHC